MPHRLRQLLTIGRPWLAIGVLAVVLTGCDTVQPVEPGTLVVEAYITPDHPPPPVRLSRSAAFGRPVGPVEGAVVRLILGSDAILYRASDDPFTYVPPPDLGTVKAGAVFELTVTAGEQQAFAAGMVPPALAIGSARVTLPEFPVEAVFLDSLDIPLDSLGSGLPSRRGFLYPVVAGFSWTPASGDPAAVSPDGWWIQTRIEPLRPFSSTLINFFLRPDAVLLEDRTERDSAGDPTWTGVYAIPVDRADEPLPDHDLLLAVIRGDAAWAAYASSSRDPARREPVGNVTGGIGIVSGVAIDTVRIQIR